MAKFLVKGTMKLGKGVALEHRPFEREFEAASEKRVRELAYTYFGSKSGLRRSAIAIESVSKA